MAKNPSRKNYLKKIARRVSEGKLVVDPKTEQVKPARKSKITNPGDFEKRAPEVKKPTVNKRAAKARGQKPLPPAFERFLDKQAASNGETSFPATPAAEVKPAKTKKAAAIKQPFEQFVEQEIEPPMENSVEPFVEKPIKAKSVKKEVASVEKSAPQKVAVETVNETSAESGDELPGFSELGLNETTEKALRAMGFETPTPIQARAIPFLLQGRDLIGQAQTGTGKTAAFALPLIERMDVQSSKTQALVLAPTRELAVQVAGGIYDLAKGSGLKVVPVYGGQPIDRQLRALRSGAHIVVGTPGRVQDHLRRGSLSLDNISLCVLDEADEMLALGFLEEIETILSELPEERQMAFFSATMPPKITTLMKTFLRNPETVSITGKKRTLETTNQAYYEVARGQKLQALARILDMETPGSTIVFCRTRQETNDLAEALRLRGHNAESLHGDMSQSERERVLKKFRDEHCDLLVATDVAARGLDIDSVTHVINYDIPWDVEQYIHRIGRTGRAGRSGDAITLVQGRELRQLKQIENQIGAKIKAVRLPSPADIAARRRENFKQALLDMLNDGDYDEHLATVGEVSEDHDLSEIAAAALQMLWKSQHSDGAKLAQEMAADGEQPEQGMTRIFVSLGRGDNLRPGDLVGLIANKTGLSGRDIGAIDILDRSSFVEVPSGSAEDAIAALRQSKLKGKKVDAQVARPRDVR